MNNNNDSFEVFIKLFDSQVQPVVQYGAEIWGMDVCSDYCEKVHLFALKNFLGVSKRTPNDFVYGELNRYPLFIFSVVKCLRYWLKLTRMEEHRLPYKAYKMLFQLDSMGKRNWATKIKMKLYENGFGYVWLNQGVENVNGFISIFRQRLIDSRWQNWNSHIQDSKRFDLYRLFNPFHHIPLYISMNISKHLRHVLTKFRFGISNISSHHNRYLSNTNNDNICPLCKLTDENEIHFVLDCPALKNVRNQYIPLKFSRHPCLFKLILLMSATNENVVRTFAMYLRKAFDMRETFLS